METKEEEEEKSSVLVIGATGHLGKYLVEASVKLGHPTLALVRRSSLDSSPSKAALVEGFRSSGVHVLYGDLDDHGSLVEAIRRADVVFSQMGPDPVQIADQMKVIAAIKEVGTFKRYIPSEFGGDVERDQMLEPARSVVTSKSQIRQAIRAAVIPFTFVVSNFFPTFFLSRLGQVEVAGLPDDKVIIFGDGNSEVIFVDEPDIAMYSIKAATDPRTLNKVLHMRPPANICSVNVIVTLWEKKVGKTLERIFLDEEEVLKKIRDSPAPLPFFYSIAHASLVKGGQTNFEIDLTKLRLPSSIRRFNIRALMSCSSS